MNLISRIILFAAAALLFPALYGAGERELAVQFAKHEDFSSAAADEVRELYRHVQQVYRLRGKPAVRNCRVMLTKAAPPGEIVVTQKRDYWLIEFDHTADWQRDRRFIARLAGIFFTAACTDAPPPKRDFMPRWIIAGILHRIGTKKGSEQLMRRNQDFIVSRALFSGDRRLPDFKELTKLPASLTESPGIIQVWTDEFSRLLLDICTALTGPSQNPLREYTAAYLGSDINSEVAFETYLSPHLLLRALRSPVSNNYTLGEWNRMPPPAKVRLYLEYTVYRRVFNNFHPQPVRELYKQFAAYRKINLPVPDAEPGTPPETFDMADYPKLLKNHPHAPATIVRKMGELGSVAEGGDMEFRDALHKLWQVLREMQKDPSDPSRRAVRDYHRQFQLIPQVLVRRQQIEHFLDEVYVQYRSPARFYEEAIRESMRRFSGETKRVSELLDHAEKQYFGTE